MKFGQNKTANIKQYYISFKEKIQLTISLALHHFKFSPTGFGIRPSLDPWAKNSCSEKDSSSNHKNKHLS